ncbi:hypothetical protein [Bradyrhizobium cenepequi]
MTQIQQRDPTESEMFQSLVEAMRRLGGECDATASAIQAQMAGPNFEAAARAIDVPLGDLVDVFRAEMLKLGFIVAPMGRVQ